MRFLAIETSSLRGSLALFEGRRFVRQVDFPEGLVHGREISSRLAALLGEASLGPRDVDGLAVSVGPGSYTGCRVGVTAAKTLAFALRVPLVEVSSLEVLAATAAIALGGGPGESGRRAPERLAPLLDGRRGFLYGALFSMSACGREPGGLPARRTPDRIGRLADLVEIVEPGTWVSGDGADVFLELLGSSPHGGRDAPVRAPREWDIPSARALGALAAARLERAPFDLDRIHALEPAYLRPSEPEILWRERSRPGPGRERVKG